MYSLKYFDLWIDYIAILFSFSFISLCSCDIILGYSTNALQFLTKRMMAPWVGANFTYIIFKWVKMLNWKHFSCIKMCKMVIAAHLYLNFALCFICLQKCLCITVSYLTPRTFWIQKPYPAMSKENVPTSICSITSEYVCVWNFDKRNFSAKPFSTWVNKNVS